MRWSAEGRGANYTKLRGFGETLMRVLYAGDWPARLWELAPQSCEVVCVHREVALLAPGEETIRVGFASDVHLGPTTPRRLAEAAFARLDAEALDVLLLGGDYVFLDATSARAEMLTGLVASVRAKTKLAVLGNHDLWTHHTRLEAALARAGAQVLCNERVQLGSALSIAGLDDPWTGTVDAGRALGGLSAGDSVVILCHSPDGLLDAERSLATPPFSDRRGQRREAGPNALYVCGHTHGGHVAAPWGPLVIPGRMGKRYPHGFHQRRTTQLYVSRGIGGIEVPFRTFAPPEVVVFDLVARQS